MAHWYIKSGAGGANTGVDWNNAFPFLANVAQGAAGDSFWVADTSAEANTTQAVYTIAVPGTNTNPCYIYTVNATASAAANSTVPPTANTLLISASPNLATNGAANVSWTGVFSARGLNVVSGGNNTTSYMIFATTSSQKFENCTLKLGNISAGQMLLGTAGSSIGLFEFTNTHIQFGVNGQSIGFATVGDYRFNNCYFDGAVFPNTVFSMLASRDPSVSLFGCDLSSYSSKTLFTSNSYNSKIQIVNCKLAATTTILGSAARPLPGVFIDVINCDSANTNWKADRYTFGGVVNTVNTDFVSAAGLGANDSQTSTSWKITTDTSPSYSIPLVAPPIGQRTSTGGKTVSVEIASSGQLNNADIWMEVQQLSNASFPISTMVSTRANTPLANAAYANSSTTWTQPNITTPNNQVMTCAISPQQGGIVQINIRVAKPSTTVWVNPRVSIV